MPDIVKLSKYRKSGNLFINIKKQWGRKIVFFYSLFDMEEAVLVVVKKKHY